MISPPSCRYEEMELSGSIRDLPPGYSFSPGKIAYSSDPQMKDVEAMTNMVSSVLPLLNEEYSKVRIPDGTSCVPPRIIEALTSDPRRIPYGFLASSPHPGYDPDRIDKDRVKYIGDFDSGGKSSEYNIPRGYTSKKVPVLWPLKEV